jgi:hypothetical protein
MPYIPSDNFEHLHSYDQIIVHEDNTPYMLVIWKTRATIKDITSLFTCLDEHPDIHTVDIRSPMENESVKILMQGLANTHIHTLHLNIDMNDEGAKILARDLASNQHIRTLNLASNRIGDKGVKDIAEALKTNRTLSNLDLSFNKFGDEGCKSLIEMLSCNVVLQKFNLQLNSGIKNQEYLNDIMGRLVLNIILNHMLNSKISSTTDISITNTNQQTSSVITAANLNLLQHPMSILLQPHVASQFSFLEASNSRSEAYQSELNSTKNMQVVLYNSRQGFSGLEKNSLLTSTLEDEKITELAIENKELQNVSATEDDETFVEIETGTGNDDEFVLVDAIPENKNPKKSWGW